MCSVKTKPSRPSFSSRRPSDRVIEICAAQTFDAFSNILKRNRESPHKRWATVDVTLYRESQQLSRSIHLQSKLTLTFPPTARPGSVPSPDARELNERAEGK